MVTFDYIPGKRKAQIRCGEAIFDLIRERFSVVNKAKAHVKDPIKKKHIPDRLYAITPTGLFDFGFYQDLRKFLISEQITEITFTDAFKKRILVGWKDWEFWDGLKYDAHYFQKESVEQCLKYGYGTYLLATGAGKSLLQALLIENIKRLHKGPFKCLIIVPGIGLVQQLEDDFANYGATFTYSGWTGQKGTGKGQTTKPLKPLQDTEVVICNTEYFISVFGTNKWITEVDVYIQDECHKINRDSIITKLVDKIKTPHRFGFTGSLPDVEENRWKVLGTFGPILYEKKSKELRDEGFLSEARVVCIKLRHRVHDMPYLEELQYIYTCEARNEFIKKLAEKFQNNTLIIVNHLLQGETLFELLKSLDRQVFFICGATPVDERERIKKLMETHTDIVTIAMASIFSTGINVKNIHYIMIVALGEAFIRLVQTIGRGLRLHESKDKLTIFDIHDTLKYSSEHALTRKGIYDKEMLPWSEKEFNL